MITFITKGRVTVVSQDYGEREFTVTPIRESESTDEFIERIMNTYWYIVGKNRRIWDGVD